MARFAASRSALRTASIEDFVRFISPDVLADCAAQDFKLKRVMRHDNPALELVLRESCGDKYRVEPLRLDQGSICLSGLVAVFAKKLDSLAG